MWICLGCSEELDDSQTECWQCGTGLDGEQNPAFERALWERDADPDHVRIVDTWRCPKCPDSSFTMRDPAQGRPALFGAPVWFTVVTCDKCGFAEELRRTSPLPPTGRGPVRITRTRFTDE